MDAERRDPHKWENLYLVRHGESTCNEVNRFAGMIDAPLTALGEAQAKEAASNWRGPPPDEIYSSPLVRARRTAQIFRYARDDDPAGAVKVILDGRINERNFGSFTLHNKAFIQREFGLVKYETALYGDLASVADAEQFKDFESRILSFLRDELHPRLAAGNRVLVVAHKYVIELLCRLILRMCPVGGYDLRLPNATVLRGSELLTYVRHESRALNLLQQWIGLNYSFVLAAGTVAGILLRHFDWLPRVPAWFSLVLLAGATTVSLARVDLSAQRWVATRRQMFCMRRMLIRYCVLPLAVGICSYLCSGDIWLFSLALLLAAPSAVTGITISRSVGGLVFPVAFMILISAAIGAAIMFPLLGLYGMSNLVWPAVWLTLISVVTLLVPLIIVLHLRRRFPIETATLAERNSAWSTVLLTLFAVLAFQHVELDSFWPFGAWAFGLGIALRGVAYLLLRRRTLYAVDEYVAMSYPNIFFVIVLASMIGVEDLLMIATWFLLPMFALAPVDEWICKRLGVKSKDTRLISFLGIEPAVDTPQAR